MLVAARLRYVAATRWGTKRYLQMNRLAEVQGHRLTFWVAGPHEGQLPKQPQPTTFSSSKEDRKCERFWTLPRSVS